ncbi:MAG: HAD family hydrolase [Nocardioides sp.]
MKDEPAHDGPNGDQARRVSKLASTLRGRSVPADAPTYDRIHDGIHDGAYGGAYGGACTQARVGVGEEAAAAVDAARTVPTSRSAAAFFDVDNTLMRGASAYHLARGLYRREFFGTRDLVGATWKQAYFRVVGREDPEHLASARVAALRIIAGHSVKEIQQIGEEIFDETMASRIWPGTRALAQLHLDKGHRVWLVTAAPIEVARIIAARLGLTGALGTVAEHVNGVYSGRLVGDLLHGPAKGVAVAALAARERLTLAECSAYSDSYNDLPMLSLVGDPCAINPDARLRAHAKAAGWQVHDYRTGRRAARVGVLASAAVAAGAHYHNSRNRRGNDGFAP